MESTEFITADGISIFGLNEVFGVVHGSQIYHHWTNYCLVSGSLFDISDKTMLLIYPSACGCCRDDEVEVSLSSCYSTEALAQAQLERLKNMQEKRDKALKG